MIEAFATVNGTSLAYDLTGQGAPVVLISGGGTLDKRGWDEQLNALAAHHLVVRYDIRGIGRSARPAAAFSPSHDLRALLEFLRIDKAHLVGLSFGGLLLQYAHLPVLQKALGGLSAAAAGLMIATGIRLLMPHRTRRTALLFAALAFTGMVFVKLPLLVVLLGLAPVSIAAARIASAKAP